MPGAEVGGRHAVERALRDADPATLRVAGATLLGVDSTLGGVAHRMRTEVSGALPTFAWPGPVTAQFSLLIADLADAVDRLAAPLRGQGLALGNAANALVTAHRDLADFQRDVRAYEAQMRAIGVACDWASIDGEAGKILEALRSRYRQVMAELERRPPARTAVADARLATVWVVPPPDRASGLGSIPPVGSQPVQVPPTADVKGGVRRG